MFNVGRVVMASSARRDAGKLRLAGWALETMLVIVANVLYRT